MSRSLARKLLQLEAMAVGAGFFSAAAVASAASDAGCPAYPWPNDGAQGGRKVFMQSDCAACHSMLPAHAKAAAPREAGAKVAETVVVVVVDDQEQEQPATARPIQSATTYTPDLTVFTTRTLQLLPRRNNQYAAQELLMKKVAALPTPVWLQLLQPHVISAPHTA